MEDKKDNFIFKKTLKPKGTIKLSHGRRKSNFNETINLISEIIENKITLEEIVFKAEEMKISNEVRKLYWFIYLDILPIDTPLKWLQILKLQRKLYNTDIYDNEHSNIKHADLAHIVKIDVNRTYQEIDLFKNPLIKQSLERILFTWSFENNDVSYVQGMNELAGTIFYVIYSSNLSHMNTHKLSNDSIDKDSISITKEIYSCLMDDNYLEHDIYLIYNSLMSRCFKQLFCYSDEKYSNMKNGLVDDFELIENKYQSNLEKIINEDVTHLKRRINKIFNFYLKLSDKEVYDYFIKNDVEPYLFLFRWILCLLTREFKLDKLIHIWDIIFAYEKNEDNYLKHVLLQNDKKALDISKYLKGYRLKSLNFMDFFIVAMLIDINSRIKTEQDEMMILFKLMNFSTEESNLKMLVYMAFNVRDVVTQRLIEENNYVFI